MSAHDSVPDSRVVMDVGEGQVVQEAGSWSIRRSLSGGGLPGQARAVSGSSVGSGQVQIDSPSGRSPWTPGPVRPGGRVRVEARADADRPWSSVAQMTARSVSGTARSRALDVDVEDDLGDMRRPVSVDPYIAAAGELLEPDACYAVTHMLRSVGLCGFPQQPADAAVYTTFHGRIEQGAGAVVLEPFYPPIFWGSAAGQAAVAGGGHIGGGSEATFLYWNHDPLPKRFYIVMAGSTSTLGLEVSGGAELSMSVRIPGAVGVRPWGSPAGGGLLPTATFERDPAWGGRTLIEVEVTGGGASTGTGYRVRAAGSAAGWSSWVTAASDGVARAWGPARTIVELSVSYSSETVLTGLCVGPTLPVDAWEPLSARIGLANMRLAPYIVSDPSAGLWETLQAFATATLGGVWRDEYGAIVYRGRQALQAGDVSTPDLTAATTGVRDRMATLPERIVSLDSLEDVPWTISMDGIADRVEVVSREVVDVSSATGSLTVWESTETTSVRGGQTVVLVADLAAAAASPAEWLPVWSTAAPATQRSRWNAFPDSDLTGAQPPDTALTITTTMLSPTRARITVHNTTTSTLYVSQLTLRVGRTWTPTEGRILSWGASEATALAPFRHDMGTWVQDDDAAAEVLQWLAGTLSQPLPVLTGVRVVPDLDRRLGTICILTDPATNLMAKCLVSGIETTHSPGSLEQRLDLTVLYTVEWDWGRWLTTRASADGGYATTEGLVATYLTNLLGAAATEADLAAWLSTGVILT